MRQPPNMFISRRYRSWFFIHAPAKSRYPSLLPSRPSSNNQTLPITIFARNSTLYSTVASCRWSILMDIICFKGKVTSRLLWIPITHSSLRAKVPLLFRFHQLLRIIPSACDITVYCLLLIATLYCYCGLLHYSRAHCRLLPPITVPSALPPLLLLLNVPHHHLC